MDVHVEPLSSPADLEWCANLMATNDPWLTLGRGREACLVVLGNTAKERYIVRLADQPVGLLVLDMAGPFAGYIQSICIAETARNRGLGSQVLEWAEKRIFRDSPNVFLCVSSFNADAQRLYVRRGFERIGLLRRFVVDEHDEVLFRKTLGPWKAFRPG
jgi:ribosomal-protein-alanine N-acetyltransferase